MTPKRNVLNSDSPAKRARPDDFQIGGMQHVLRDGPVPATTCERPSERRAMMSTELLVQIGHDQR